MGSISGDELSYCGSPKSNVSDERILVSVRLRPLNDKELERNEVSDWECINNSTIVFKNSMYPTAYTFDRVFGCDSSTEQVYEEAAKEVALQVLSGINSTIFAYGQTNSGKTYTMSGITESTVADIFNYIDTNKDREFILKFSAIEIYNESVRDLLSADNTPLRLLDDPERGTVVEKLIEETVEDWSHLKELLSICEAQRQIGETALNELSSRSHQILRLTIESSSSEFLGAQKSSILNASVNFVDLAGSERASHAMSAGTRLKEGCHINRSLLTLGTVIRKLSKGRNAHIPYRDSKLTRILQNSLGGNARTAIICTMSPSRTQVEQSRNTLLFANCAKEVTTNAQVNLVVSDKALVKQLQKELAKLESELKKSALMAGMPNSSAELKEKEVLIGKMEHEIRELKEQRDRAISRAQDLLGSGGEYHEYQVSRPLAEGNMLLKPYVQHTWIGECSASETSDVTSSMSHPSDRYDFIDSHKHEFSLLDNVDGPFLSDDTSPREEIEKLFGPDPLKGWEMAVQKQHKDSINNSKEVQHIEGLNIDSNLKSNTPVSSEIDISSNYEALKKKIKVMQRTISYLASSHPTDKFPRFSEADKSTLKLTRSRSCRAFFAPTAALVKTEESNNAPPHVFAIDFLGRLKSSYSMKDLKMKYDDGVGNLTRKEPVSVKVTPVDEKKQNIKHPFEAEADAASVVNCTTSLDEAVSPQHGKQFVNKAVSPQPGKQFVNEAVSPQHGKQFVNEAVSPQHGKQFVNEAVSPQHGKQFVNEAVSPQHGKQFVNEVVSPQHEKKFGDDPIQEAKPITEALAEAAESKSKESTDKLEIYINIDEKSCIHNPDDYEPTLSKCKSTEETGDNMVQDSPQVHSNWPAEFERQLRDIIEFWDQCNVPVSHRTRFFLLFKGDPSDSVYMEVELRRLSFLKSKLFQGTLVIDGRMLTLALSKRGLNRERRMLSKQMLKKFSTKAREDLYQKWDIKLTSKQRRLQLCHRIWTDTKDMEHISDSAAIVARLVGFSESDQFSKEMFGFNLMPRHMTRSKSFSWS